MTSNFYQKFRSWHNFVLYYSFQMFSIKWGELVSECCRGMVKLTFEVTADFFIVLIVDNVAATRNSHIHWLAAFLKLSWGSFLVIFVEVDGEIPLGLGWGLFVAAAGGGSGHVVVGNGWHFRWFGFEIGLYNFLNYFNNNYNEQNNQI